MLDPILNTSMRIAIGAYRTSPTLSVLCESNMLPLKLRREKLTLNYALRLHTNPKNQANILLDKRTDAYNLIRPRITLSFYYRAATYLMKNGIYQIFT